MVNFNDIKEQYEQIKDAPEVIEQTRSNDLNKATGKSADAHDLRQDILPDEQTHARLQEKYSTMFDKSSRAGAKSTLGGLVLPNGRKNFSEFHDNFTGTGRYKKQEVPKNIPFSDNAPKVDPYPDKVILYERCPQCKERVDQQNFAWDMNFVPTPESLEVIEDEVRKNEELEWLTKWKSVGVGPGTLIGYLLCAECPKKTAEEVRKIRHDPFASAITIGMDENGRPITLADLRSREYIAKVKSEIKELVFNMVKNERNNPESEAFYGNTVL